MEKPAVISDIRMMELGKGISRAEADHAIAGEQRDDTFRETVELVRTDTIAKINKALEAAKLHLCWITEGDSLEPISYGLAEEDGDEIDIAVLDNQARAEALIEEMPTMWAVKNCISQTYCNGWNDCKNKIKDLLKR